MMACGVALPAFGQSEVPAEAEVERAEALDSLGSFQGYDLDELVVTTVKPLITKEIDRIGYDVQADTEAKTSPLADILRKVPLVSVDPDGTIKVKGSTNFKIYKNGRPNNSFSRNAKDIFKALPASMIKKIEVITDPGAREDAEGTSAILNIVTMNNTVIKGVMGNASLNYDTNEQMVSPNIWLNSQIDKFNVSLYAGYNKMTRHGHKFSSESERVYDDSGNRLSTESEGSAHGQLGYGGIDMSLELDTLNLFTAEFGGYFYDLSTDGTGRTAMTARDGSPIYSYITRDKSAPNRYADFNGNFNYQRSTRHKGEMITLSYLISTTDQKQHSISEYDEAVNLPVPYTGTDNDFHLSFLENTIQLDWTRPCDEHNKFDVGGKYINRRNHSVNRQEYFNYSQEFTDFIHTTQVAAFYFDYRLKYGRWGARAGLRYEYSHLGAKYRDGSGDPFGSSLSDWVPNASVSYDLNDANTFKLAYSTRINRPGISQLNPAVVNTPTSISTGNPDLGSSRHQSLSLNYSYMSRLINLDYNASYSFSNNSVIGTRELLAGDITYSSYANAGRNRGFYTNLWAQINAGMKTQIMFNVSADYNYSSNRFTGLKESGWGYSGYARVRQSLPYDFSVSVMGSVWNSARGLYSYMPFSWGSSLFWHIDISKQLLKEKRLTLRLAWRNPFMPNPRKYVTRFLNSGYTGYDTSYAYGATNVVSFSVSYRFGSLNASVKKTAKSIANDDLEGRKN